MCVATAAISYGRGRLASKSPNAASAVSKFGGFKPSAEGPQPVRQPLVAGDELQRLRDKRAMLKTMTPEQAYHAIEWVRANLTFFEALALARETGKLIVPNDVIDRILTETEYRIPQVRAGTIIIYEASCKPFKDKVVYEGIRFSVPERFRSKIDCALAVDHPDFDLLPLENGRHRLVVPDKSNLHMIDGSPAKNGRYYSHTVFPQGEEVEQGISARYLCRFVNSSYLGLLVRADDFSDFIDRRYAVLGDQPSNRFGVALI